MGTVDSRRSNLYLNILCFYGGFIKKKAFPVFIGVFEQRNRFSVIQCGLF